MPNRPSLEEIFADRPSLEEVFGETSRQEPRERTLREYVLPSFTTSYEEKPGERTLLGDIVERPGAAVRSAIQGGFKPGAYAKGAIQPENVPYFQDMALKKYYNALPENINPMNPLVLAAGTAVSAAGMGADIATNPFDVATIMAPYTRVGKSASQAISKSRAGQSIGRFMTKERHLGKTAPQLEKKAVDIYRQVLRPTQGEVKNIEIRKGGKIKDPLTIAAEERLPIGISKEGGVNKIDTTIARQQLSKRIDDVDASLSKTLSKSVKEKKYIDLKQVASEAKKQARASTQNDTVYKSIAQDIDEYIDDAISARARYVSAAELNNIKRGMYQVGYNAMKPTSDKAARLIGRSARAKIERTFSDKNIAKINKTLGDYITLQSLLENAQGRVVAGGRVGKYLAQGIGSGIGIAAGSPIPYVGPIAGGLMGRTAGAKAAEVLTNPSRLTAKAARLADKAGISGRSWQGIVTGKYAPIKYRRGITQAPEGTNRLLAVLAERFGNR